MHIRLHLSSSFITPHGQHTQQQLYTIQTHSEIIKHKKIKMTKSEHYSTILKKVSISHLLPYFSIWCSDYKTLIVKL